MKITIISIRLVGRGGLASGGAASAIRTGVNTGTAAAVAARRRHVQNKLLEIPCRRMIAVGTASGCRLSRTIRQLLLARPAALANRAYLNHHVALISALISAHMRLACALI